MTVLQITQVLEDKVGTKHSAHNSRHRLDESNRVDYRAELADALEQRHIPQFFRIVKFEALEKPPLPSDYQYADTDLAA